MLKELLLLLSRVIGLIYLWIGPLGVVPFSNFLFLLALFDGFKVSLDQLLLVQIQGLLHLLLSLVLDFDLEV